jgi:hypothetical protein
VTVVKTLFICALFSIISLIAILSIFQMRECVGKFHRQLKVKVRKLKVFSIFCANGVNIIICS